MKDCFEKGLQGNRAGPLLRNLSGGFQKFAGPFLEVPNMRIMAFECAYWAPF